jgi:hypothetical protein
MDDDFYPTDEEEPAADKVNPTYKGRHDPVDLELEQEKTWIS